MIVITYDFVYFTTSLAERLLRDIVLYRKIRRLVASENGKKILVKHATVFQTWKLRGFNPYNELLYLLDNYDAST